MAKIQIDPAEVKAVLEGNAGNGFFKTALNRVSGPLDLLRILANYIHFNAIFGSGVASLAGAIGVRQDLFQNQSASMKSLADCSVEIAARIFYAAIEEFGSPTHRAMAKATLIGAAKILDFDLSTIQIWTFTKIGMERVKFGYGSARRLEEEGLFHGIGFHIGSERLADGEFPILDEYLRAKQARLVQRLLRTRINFDGCLIPAYRWIQLHTTVEAEHADKALEAANLALSSYAGEKNREQVKQWICEGIEDFSRTQTKFMETLEATIK